MISTADRSARGGSQAGAQSGSRPSPDRSPSMPMPDPGAHAASEMSVGAHAQPIIQKALELMTETVRGVVITVSDRSYRGEREDLSGPLAARLLAEHKVAVEQVMLVPDGIESVREALTRALATGARVILTTGGTGVTPRDLTPEATLPFLDCRMEGLEAQVRTHGLSKTPLAGLSRGYIGVTSRDDEGALIINAPGSRGGVKDAIEVMGPLVPHVLEQLGNGDH